MDRLQPQSDVAILRSRVSRFLNNGERRTASLTAFFKRFDEHQFPAVIFGGTLRDLMIYGRRKAPRDIDLVVDGVAIDELSRLFQDVLVRRTRFGGLHLNITGWMVDVWPLSDTWALRELRVGERDFEALTRTTFLNVEAVVIDLALKRGKRRVYSSGFFESLRTGTLDINLEENPFPELSTVRTLITAWNLNYRLSKRLAQYVVHYLNRTPFEYLVEVQVNHYGLARLNVDAIHAWSKAIREQINTGSQIRLPKAHFQLPLWEDCSLNSEAA